MNTAEVTIMPHEIFIVEKKDDVLTVKTMLQYARERQKEQQKTPEKQEQNVQR